MPRQEGKIIMKFKKYSIVWAMSLLIVSMSESFASWKRPLTGAGSALGSAAYYGNSGQGAMPQQVNVPNPVVYPKSTDFSTYKSMTDVAYKFPISKAVYPKKEPSKLAQATEKLEKFIVDQLKEELDAIKKEGATISEQDLKWSQLISEQQKLEYLKNELKEFKIVDDAYLPLCIKYFNDRVLEFSNDKTKIDQFIQANIICMKFLAYRYSGVISMDIYNTLIDLSEFSFIGRIIESIFFNPITLKCTDYHEGAHALMMALVMQTQIALNATNRSHMKLTISGTNLMVEGSAGHMQSIRRDLNESELQALAIDQKSFGALQALHLDAQNVIMMNFAGVIGDMIGRGKEKVSFKDYLGFASENGGGDRITKGTDVYYAYKIAGSYIRWKNFSRISKYQDEQGIDEIEFQEEVDDFMEESYEKAYALLMKNRAKLDLMANAIGDKRQVYMDEIYSIAGVIRPKFNSEFTFLDKFKQDLFNWFVWTAERIKFYEKQHPQE